MLGLTLRSIRYVEYPDHELEWSLDTLSFGSVNLLVGKNATGKSRALNIVSNLAKNLLSKGPALHSELGCEAEFEGDGTTVKYELRIHGGKVKREKLTVDDEVRLNREDGLLKIWAEELKQTISFRPDASEIAAAARRDTLQHGFLTAIHDWASSLRHYHFGSSLGKESMVVYVEGGIANKVTNVPPLDDRNEDAIVAIYKKAKVEFGDEFDAAVIGDMKEIGYEVTAVVVDVPHGVKFEASIPVAGTLNAIGVREAGVGGPVFQNHMSQGMFRAFSVIIQVNYCQMSRRASCILIDDIGEGLDFDRSARLIEILRRKSLASSFQLIMATNDRFVMNHVPLEEWSILQRSGNHVSVKNRANSKEQFDEFKFVGMSNFSFFEMDFVSGDPEGADAK